MRFMDEEIGELWKSQTTGIHDASVSGDLRRTMIINLIITLVEERANMYFEQAFCHGPFHECRLQALADYNISEESYSKARGIKWD